MESKRKNIRLSGYNYSQSGAYFITICTEDRAKILADIRRGDSCGRPSTHLTELGEIAENTIYSTEQSYNIQIDKYVIMPNHIHFIMLLPNNKATARVAPTVGTIIGAYKSLISNQWLKVCKRNNQIMGQLWQRNYYDHIIRNEQEYQQIWQYIDDNPIKWELDEYYN